MSSQPTASPLALQLAPWSMSKAELARNCSFQFHLKYVQKEKKKTPPKSIAGKVGVAAHEALEKFLDGDDISPERLQQLIVRAANGQQLTTTEVDEVVVLAQNIMNFRRRLDAYRERNRVVETRLENKFGLSLDGQVVPFFGSRGAEPFFRGVIDLIMRTENDTIVILDHKSGAAPTSSRDALKQHEHQLKLYAIAALAMFPNLREVQTGLHYIQNEQIIFSTSRNMPDEIRGDLTAWYLQYLNEAAEASLSNKANQGWYCRFCEYTPYCPLRR